MSTVILKQGIYVLDCITCSYNALILITSCNALPYAKKFTRLSIIVKDVQNLSFKEMCYGRSVQNYYSVNPELYRENTFYTRDMTSHCSKTRSTSTLLQNYCIVNEFWFLGEGRLRGGVFAMCGVTVGLLVLLCACVVILQRQRSRRLTITHDGFQLVLATCIKSLQF